MSKEEIEELAFRHCEKYVSLVAKNVIFSKDNEEGIEEFLSNIIHIYPKYFLAKNRNGSYIVLDHFLKCESLEAFECVTQIMNKIDPRIYLEYNHSGNVMFEYYIEFFRQKNPDQYKPFSPEIPFNTKFLNQFKKDVLVQHNSIEKIFNYVVKNCSLENIRNLFVFYKSIDKDFLKNLDKDIELINWNKGGFECYSKQRIILKVNIILEELKDTHQYVFLTKKENPEEIILKLLKI